MKAVDLKKITNNNLKTTSRSYLDVLLLAMKSEAIEGNYSISLSFKVSKEDCDVLVKKGFKVDSMHNACIISWDNPIVDNGNWDNFQEMCS